jgi:hypothetical protein
VLWALLGILVSHSLIGNSQSAQPFDPDLHVNTASNGLVSLAWQSRAGSLFTVEASTDAQNWGNIDSYYGLGQELQLAVAQIPPANNNGGNVLPPPPSNIISAYFILSVFERNQKTLVFWRDAGQPVMALVDLNFKDVSAPLLMTNITDSAGQEYALSFTRANLAWNASFETDYAGTAHLTQPQADRLAILTNNYTAIHSAMEAVAAGGSYNHGTQAGAVAGGAASAGTRAFYRIVVEEIDSDGDGLSDSFEFLIGINPFVTDTDGDGYDDELEVTYGSDPSNPASTPANVIPPPAIPGVDTDKDGLEDAIDFDPLDPNINWLATAPASYVPFEYAGSDNLTPVAVNNYGEALFTYNVDLGSLGKITLYSEVWRPGQSPVYLSAGSENFSFEVFNEDEGEMETIDLVPSAALVRAINDDGTIVGAVIFTGTMQGQSGGSSSGSSFSHAVAARWATATYEPVLVHTGKEEGAAADGSDVLLPSVVTKINNAGEMIGLAAVVKDQEASEQYTTRWNPNAADNPGTPQFSGATPPPLSSLSAIGNLSESDDPTLQYFGNKVSGGGAGIWDTWAEHPQTVRPEIGSSAIEAALMPNGTRAVLGTERLLLNTPIWQQVPAVRKIPGASHVTERGTVFRTNESGEQEFWHAAKMAAFKVSVNGSDEAVLEIADVSSEGVVFAKIDGSDDYAVLYPFYIVSASLLKGEIVVNIPKLTTALGGTLDLVLKKQGGGEVIAKTVQNQLPGEVTLLLDEILTGGGNIPPKPFDGHDGVKFDKLYARWRVGTFDIKTVDTDFDKVLLNGELIEVSSVEVLAARKITNYYSPEWSGPWSGATRTKGVFNPGNFPGSLSNEEIPIQLLNAINPSNEGLAMDGNTVIRLRYRPFQVGYPRVTSDAGNTIPDDLDTSWYPEGYIARPDVDQDSASSPNVKLLRDTSVAVRTNADRLTYDDLVYVPDIPEFHLRTVDDSGELNNNVVQIDVWRGQGGEALAATVHAYTKPASTCFKVIRASQP